MISRIHRFKGHNSVSRVRGTSIRMPYFSVFYARNKKRQAFRMAVVVSKKTAKLAATRNRIRRRLYEAVRVNAGLNSCPYDVVFVVKDQALAHMSADELQLQVARTIDIITAD